MADVNDYFKISFIFLLFLSQIIVCQEDVKDTKKAKQDTYDDLSLDDEDNLLKKADPKEILEMMDESLKNEIVMDTLKAKLYEDDETTKPPELQNDNIKTHAHKDNSLSDEEITHAQKDTHEQKDILSNQAIADDEIYMDQEDFLRNGEHSPMSDDELDEIMEDEKFIETKLKRIAKKDPFWFYRRRTSRRRIKEAFKTLGRHFNKAGKAIGTWYRRTRFTKKNV